MIYTITLNPALDISGVVDELIPDEKNYVRNVIKNPGGNGVNAGIIASRLGSKVTMTGFIGGANGREFKSLLHKENIKDKFVPIESSTRLNITVSNSKIHTQTRLSFPGPRITHAEWLNLETIIDKIKVSDLVIIGGSLPAGISATKISSLINFFRIKGIFCLVDVPSSVLRNVIKARPDFIKPNLKEFQELTNSKVFRMKDVIREMKRLNKYVPLICVSSVEGGALISNSREVWFAKGPALDIKSTVGAGDSMVGAMSTLLSKDSEAPLSDLLQVGLAASCATLSRPGLKLGSKSGIKNFIPQIQLRKIRD